MSRIHYLTLLAVILVVVGSTWQNPLLLYALLKNIAFAFVLARLAVRFRVCNCKAALQLGMSLWIGFQSLILMSIVIHQKALAALFATPGDVHRKTWMISVMLGGWSS